MHFILRGSRDWWDFYVGVPGDGGGRFLSTLFTLSSVLFTSEFLTRYIYVLVFYAVFRPGCGLR